MRGRATWAANVVRRQAKSSPAILRRSNNLNVPVVVAIDAAQGATSFTLKSAGVNRLTGKVVAGTQFIVAPTTYTVSNDSETQPNGNLVLTFSPALVVAQIAGTAITFSRSYIEVNYPTLLRQVEDLDTKATSDGHTIRILPFDAGKPKPAQNDRLDGVGIFRVEEVSADDGIGYFLCHVETGKPS